MKFTYSNKRDHQMKLDLVVKYLSLNQVIV